MSDEREKVVRELPGGGFFEERGGRLDLFDGQGHLLYSADREAWLQALSEREEERVVGYVTSDCVDKDRRTLTVETHPVFPEQDPPPAVVSICHPEPAKDLRAAIRRLRDSSEGGRVGWIRPRSMQGMEVADTWEVRVASSEDKEFTERVFIIPDPDEDSGEDVLGRESKSGPIPWDEPLDAGEQAKSAAELLRLDEDLARLEERIRELTDEGSGEGEEMRWTDEDEAELRDYQARVSCAGRYDQYEPTRNDHSRLAELKERKKRTTKAWFRQVEEYQNLSDSALEQVARYRAEQGGVNPDTAALLVLLCERWSCLRERLEGERVEGEITAVNFHAGYAVVEVDLTEDELRELIHRRVRIIHEPTREEGA